LNYIKILNNETPKRPSNINLLGTGALALLQCCRAFSGFSEKFVINHCRYQSSIINRCYQPGTGSHFLGHIFNVSCRIGAIPKLAAKPGWFDCSGISILLARCPRLWLRG
jgi:hypothetical protein